MRICTFFREWTISFIKIIFTFLENFQASQYLIGLTFRVSSGSAHGTHNNSSFTLESNINLSQGLNSISLLSATVGLPVIFRITRTIYLVLFLNNKSIYSSKFLFALHSSSLSRPGSIRLGFLNSPAIQLGSTHLNSTVDPSVRLNSALLFRF